MQENDYTLNNLCFRLKIDGKGCDGFTYALGFSEKLPDDKVLTLGTMENQIEIIIDPFTAHYCQNGDLDFLFVPDSNEDGFIFTNHNEANYKGKFFKDESMVPASF